jgi:putative transposase
MAVPSLVSVPPRPVSEGALRTDVLSLYQRTVTPQLIEQVLQKEGVRQNNRIYHPQVVIWLMAQQRLHGNASMERAVANVVHGLPAEFWPQPCKRLLEGRVSSNDTSYSTARQQLPLPVVEQIADEVFERLLEQTGGGGPVLGRRAFFIDGTSLRTPHRPELQQQFPPTSNQHGESHWPVLKMLVAHDLETGLAMRPVWGAMSGEQAVSEQALFEKWLADRVPAGAVLVADINFGIFSVAYAADQRHHPVVLRMQEHRARALLGGPLVDGIDRELEWRPSGEDRKRHPELPADACVRGRLLVTLVRPSNGADAFLLVLFTTIGAGLASREELLQWYGKRWNIELDLRTLKSTLKLEQLTATSPEMIAKEIQVGMVTYNLVRAVMYAAAAQSGLAPRGYSFARVRNLVEHFLPFIAAARTQEEAQALTDKMMYCVGQAKLRSGKGRRSYPRAAWGKPRTFPSRKA